MRRQSIIVANIHISTRWRRNVDEKVIDGLVASISALGLRSPISIVFRDGVVVDGEEEDGVPVLVAGRHRLEALRRLGWQTVECDVFDDDVDAEKWEISENLHRAELKALERDVQIARWIELTELKMIDADKLSASRSGQRGVPAVVTKQLGVDAKDAQRAVKVAALPAEAKQAAKDAGLDDNRSALLAVARAEAKAKEVGEDGTAAAVLKVQEIARQRAAPRIKSKPANEVVVEIVQDAAREIGSTAASAPISSDDPIARLLSEIRALSPDLRERLFFELQSDAIFSAKQGSPPTRRGGTDGGGKLG